MGKQQTYLLHLPEVDCGEDGQGWLERMRQHKIRGCQLERGWEKQDEMLQEAQVGTQGRRSYMEKDKLGTYPLPGRGFTQAYVSFLVESRGLIWGVLNLQGSVLGSQSQGSIQGGSVYEALLDSWVLDVGDLSTILAYHFSDLLISNPPLQPPQPPTSMVIAYPHPQQKWNLLPKSQVQTYHSLIIIYWSYS